MKEIKNYDNKTLLKNSYDIQGSKIDHTLNKNNLENQNKKYKKSKNKIWATRATELVLNSNVMLFCILRHPEYTHKRIITAMCTTSHMVCAPAKKFETSEDLFTDSYLRTLPGDRDLVREIFKTFVLESKTSNAIHYDDKPGIAAGYNFHNLSWTYLKTSNLKEQLKKTFDKLKSQAKNLNIVVPTIDLSELRELNTKKATIKNGTEKDSLKREIRTVKKEIQLKRKEIRENLKFEILNLNLNLDLETKNKPKISKVKLSKVKGASISEIKQELANSDDFSGISTVNIKNFKSKKRTLEKRLISIDKEIIDLETIIDLNKTAKETFYKFIKDDLSISDDIKSLWKSYNSQDSLLFSVEKFNLEDCAYVYDIRTKVKTPVKSAKTYLSTFFTFYKMLKLSKGKKSSIIILKNLEDFKESISHLFFGDICEISYEQYKEAGLELSEEVNHLEYSNALYNKVVKPKQEALRKLKTEKSIVLNLVGNLQDGKIIFKNRLNDKTQRDYNDVSFLSSNLRDFLLADTHISCDISNCAPTILSNISYEEGLKLPALAMAAHERSLLQEQTAHLKLNQNFKLYSLQKAFGAKNKEFREDEQKIEECTGDFVKSYNKDLKELNIMVKNNFVHLAKRYNLGFTYDKKNACALLFMNIESKIMNQLIALLNDDEIIRIHDELQIPKRLKLTRKVQKEVLHILRENKIIIKNIEFFIDHDLWMAHVNPENPLRFDEKFISLKDSVSNNNKNKNVQYIENNQSLESTLGSIESLELFELKNLSENIYNFNYVVDKTQGNNLTNNSKSSKYPNLEENELAFLEFL